MDMTMTFSFDDNHDADIRKTMLVVYDALKEKGYNPINRRLHPFRRSHLYYNT